MNWESKFKDNLLQVLYRSDQPRDEKGRWTSGGSASPGSADKVYDWALNKFGDPDTARNFTEWFGDSKVVDADGNPQVVYHGTTADFDEFAAGPITKSGHGDQMSGMYFTPRPAMAELFADYTAIVRGEWDEHDKTTGQKMYPAYLSVKNPRIYTNAEDFQGADRLSLEAQGYDGAIRKLDGGIMEIVVFNPTQIKSATGNKGTFDPNNPNITLIIKSDKKP